MEGAFARIEHHVSEHKDYWEVCSRNGLRSVYGMPGMRGRDPATIQDPDDAQHVFSWSLTETTDPFSNRIEYTYERDPVGEDGPHRWYVIRPKAIRYADYGDWSAPQFLVTITFLYEPRPDAFSSYRAGFEIQTTQRCADRDQHPRPDEPAGGCLPSHLPGRGVG
jgi:hypothetical protein